MMDKEKQKLITEIQYKIEELEKKADESVFHEHEYRIAISKLYIALSNLLK